MSAALPLQQQQIFANASYTTREISEIIFRMNGPDWFYRNRDELIAKEGFPLPISSMGHPRWRGADLIAWMSRDRGAAPTAGGPGFENVLSMRTKNIRRKRA